MLRRILKVVRGEVWRLFKGWLRGMDTLSGEATVKIDFCPF